ncbi:MAG TPA: gamma carbonic anhydrase family protein [Candidatus Competibacteraceae bacterium]|nr:gamma carbonic anhydrase family protein [Hyphomicrobiaceae bacterium]HRY16690.1 gamma carbonic anhydrase family protein [Candidatus Competibacteraceae bacterium]
MTCFSLDGTGVRTPANGRFWIAPNAVVIGNVELEEDASVWFGTSIRGDNEPIRIGARSNIQEGCVLHTDPGFPMTIGPDVTVGHMVMLHGCTIGARALIGIGSIILNGAEIGEGSLVGANTLVPEGKKIPPRSMVLGSPGRVVRELSPEDVEKFSAAAGRYVENWQRFKAGMKQQDE